jgi:hypothetical protein
VREKKKRKGKERKGSSVGAGEAEGKDEGDIDTCREIE